MVVLKNRGSWARNSSCFYVRKKGEQEGVGSQKVTDV